MKKEMKWIGSTVFSLLIVGASSTVFAQGLTNDGAKRFYEHRPNDQGQARQNETPVVVNGQQINLNEVNTNPNDKFIRPQSWLDESAIPSVSAEEIAEIFSNFTGLQQQEEKKCFVADASSPTEIKSQIAQEILSNAQSYDNALSQVSTWIANNPNLDVAQALKNADFRFDAADLETLRQNWLAANPELSAKEQQQVLKGVRTLVEMTMLAAQELSVDTDGNKIPQLIDLAKLKLGEGETLTAKHLIDTIWEHGGEKALIAAGLSKEEINEFNKNCRRTITG